jgi:hypothetical protein
MVMHACILDADLGRKISKTEASISGIADTGLRQVQKPLSGRIHRQISFYRQIDIDAPSSHRYV